MKLLVLLLTAALAIPTSAYALRLVVFGDSISVGVAATKQANTYVDRLSHRIGPNWRTLNYSRGGWSVAGTAGVILPANIQGAADLWPSAVLIALGTNDFIANVPLEHFQAKYKEMVWQFSNFPTVKRVYCLTPLYRRNETKKNATGATIADYRQAIAVECAAEGGTVLDGKEAIPNSDDYLDDAVHPNDLGHRELAQWLVKKLRGILP